MKKRTLAFAAGALTLGLALTSCTGTQPEQEQEYDEPVDLSMTVWTGDENVIAAYQELADEFREDNPELGELTIQTLPFAEYVAQLTIQLSGGDAPDLGWIVESTTPAWVDSGALHDVGALKDDPAWEYDDIVATALEELEGEDGELYGYPFANTTHPIIYNASAFEAAGVETPLELFERGEWTWDNLKRIAKEMVDSGAVTYGFDIPQFAFTNYTLFEPILKGFGGVAWPGGDECGLTSDESVEAYEYLHSMIFEDSTYPGPGSASSFPTGDTAMFLNAPSILSQLTDVGFEFDMVAQPTGDADYNPFAGQASMVAFEAGEAPELATRLLGYFTGPEGVERLAPYYVTPRESALTPERVTQLSPLLTPEAAQRALIDTLEFAKPVEFPVAYPEVESATRPVLDSIWVPDSNIPSVLADACAAAEPLIR